MSRSPLRVLPVLFVLSAAACATPTAPVPARLHLAAPSGGTSLGDIVPVDTTCKSGYNLGQGKTC